MTSRWSRCRTRRVGLAAGLVVVVVGGTVLGLALTANAGGRPAASATSYCQASQAVSDYHGHRAATLEPLLSRVAARAPVDVAPEVRAMRAARLGSPGFEAAEQAWRHYNTDHCCTCIGGPNVPQIAVTTPP